MTSTSFSDSFGSLSAKWSFETGSSGLTTFMNKTSDAKIVTVGNGLNLLAGWSPNPALFGNRPYKGVKLSTRNSFTQTYGYFEAKLSASAKAGQLGGLYLSNGLTVGEVTSGSDTATHTYGLIWAQNDLIWLKDGKLVKHVVGKTPTAPTYLILQNLITSKPSSGDTLGVHSVTAQGLDMVTFIRAPDGNIVSLTVGSNLITIEGSVGPTPAPAFTTQPSISPSSGTGGQTFTGSDGVITNGTVSARQWLLGGTAISGATGASYVSQSTDSGSLTYRVTAMGSGGSTTATSAPATVTPAATTFTPPGTTTAYKQTFLEDWSTPLSFRTGGPTSAGYEAGTGRYAIGPYYRGDTTAGANEPRGFFENNNVGGNPIANCYVDPTSPAWAAAGFDTTTLYKINNGVLEFHNKRVSNADGSIVPGMEAVAAFFPSGAYAEKWLCGWLTTAHSIFNTVPMYFEHTTQYAGVVGNWPTMWMLGRDRVLNRSNNDLEIDSGEDLGQYAPNAALNFTAHNQVTGVGVGNATITGAVGSGGVAGAYDWAGSGGPRYLPGQTTANPAYNPTTAFHTYGALVLADRAIFSMDGIVLHTAMFTPNATGGWTIPSGGLYALLSMGGMGGNGGVPAAGTNEIVNKVKSWRFAQPA